MEAPTILDILKRLLLPAMLAALALFLATPEQTNAAVVTITINSVDDFPDTTPADGLCKTGANTCTLRAAIMHATALGPGNSYIISFAGIGSVGNVPKIKPSSALPQIPFVVTMNGSTSPAGRVELSGESASAANTPGLTILSAGAQIRNLVINRFTGDAILIIGGSATVRDNMIGTDAGGTIDRGNGQSGVFISGAGANTIGPDNFIAANRFGVEITGGVGGNVVKGNLIGHSSTSGQVLTQNTGVVIDAGSDNNLIGGVVPEDANSITGGEISGIEINGSGTTGNRVFGNEIGTNAAGLAGAGNDTGVRLNNFASGNFIGGSGVNEGNTISSNGTGVLITGSSFGNFVRGNSIGVVDGEFLTIPNDNEGIRIQSSANGNTVGGAGSAGNVISGNDGAGVLIAGANTHSNSVQGNYIGTDSSGTQDFGNGGTGVGIEGGAHDNTIGGTTEAARNFIVNNGGDGGVYIAGDDNTVHGNYIGVAPDGTLPMPNDEAGVTIEGSANNIGGSGSGEGNVISGHSLANVRSRVGTDTVIDGNFIGTNAAGTAALDSGAGAGIILSTTTIVGGRGSGNIIGGNTDGVVLSSLDALGSIINGNAIGVAADTVSPLPNTQNGVLVSASLPEAQVQVNIIAFNGGAGVNVAAAGASGVEISSNQIFENGGLGIDLGADGVTPNDGGGDADAGANGLLNAPVIVPIGDGDYEVTLDSVPNSTFFIDFFQNDECDPSGHGEGRIPIFFGSILDAVTDADGHFSVTREGGPALLTATAINIDTRDTSEFSECVDTDVPGPGTPTPTPDISETPPPGTVTPTATASITPPPETGSPTATATAPTSPTPTGTPGGLVQGDLNCDGNIDEEDALAPILSEAELPVDSEPGCPQLGDDLGNVVFGDVNCSGAVDLEDALALFLFLAGLEFDVNRPCADIGSELVTDGPPPP